MDKNTIIARKSKDGSRIQYIEEHSRNVAKICSDIMGRIGLPSIGETGSELHDSGKCGGKFQNYINVGGIRGSVNHSAVGAEFVYHRYYLNAKSIEEKILAQLIVMVVYSHHGFLFDCLDPTTAENVFEQKMKEHSNCNYEEIMQVFFENVISESEIDELFAKAVEELKVLLKRIKKTRYNVGMILKFSYSALIDSDRFDAYCYEAGIIPLPPEAPDWKTMAENLEKRISQFKADTPINKARAYISDKCLEASDNPLGIYRLSVPTGGGKTLSSLRFALNFAKKNGCSHVFYVIPYTTIIDQTAAEVCSICGKENVTVHHSGIIPEEETENIYRLLTERWSSPVILTTSVQFMNALYSGKSACARRMNALCNSVIIVDEVQALPKKTVSLFTSAINFLSSCCKSTVLLCTATPPRLEIASYPVTAAEIAPLNEEMKKPFVRTHAVNLCLEKEMTTREISELALTQLKQENSVLVIMNTVSTARAVYNYAKESQTCKMIFLSSKKCGEHKREHIDFIKAYTQKIKNKNIDETERLLVVSTQLVEAGVDFSCGCVIRAEAGMDSAAQAAGRCNRNGELDHICNVFMVRCADEKLDMLPEIENSKECAHAVFTDSHGEITDFLSERAQNNYYAKYFRTSDNEFDEKEYIIKLSNGNRTTLMELLGNNTNTVSNYRRMDGKDMPFMQSFNTAGKAFRMIESNTSPVIVPYEDGAEYIKIICGSGDFKQKADALKKCSAYTVNLFDHEIKALSNALITVEELGVTVLAEGYYNEEYGVVTNGGQPFLNY